MIVPSDVPDDKTTIRFSKNSVLNALKGKKINTVYLDGDRALTTKKLHFILLETKKLNFYHDTNTVVKVHFSDQSIYDDFIQVMDIISYNRLKRYVLIDYDFYIFGDPPPEPDTGRKLVPFICEVVKVEHKIPWWQPFVEWSGKTWHLIKNNAVLLSAYILLIVAPAFYKLTKNPDNN